MQNYLQLSPFLFYVLLQDYGAVLSIFVKALLYRLTKQNLQFAARDQPILKFHGHDRDCEMNGCL